MKNQLHQLYTSLGEKKLIEHNSQVIEQEIAWFSKVLTQRIEDYFSHTGICHSILHSPPALSDNHSTYGNMVSSFQMTPEERLVVMLALLPHISPHVLDIFCIKNNNIERNYTEFGGINSLSRTGFIPTGETARFLIAGDDVTKGFFASRLFTHDHYFYKENIIKLSGTTEDGPSLSGILKISEEYLQLLTTGKPYYPSYTSDFPAKKITTSYEWEELVLDDEVREKVHEVIDWITYGESLLQDWGLEKRIAPGYRALFQGPSGTGKTLTVSLIGKVTGLEVYRVDLSMTISKYIGETQKNLAALFDVAHNKQWILFFDEADSLFSTRTETQTSNDRSANQEVAYLLQRIEDFPGVIILATNLLSNIDTAFIRRFQTLVRFQLPDSRQRLQLWKQCYEDEKIPLDQAIDFETIAETYDLSGGNIINILRSSCIRAIKRENQKVTHKDILEGIKKEYEKLGRLFPK
ncbi:MAG: ATP-binding protein [Spirochaetales bacterium]|nr:ATP-binding protein [Spirochaetales bacterium]